jgi:type III pantothenate kinase
MSKLLIDIGNSDIKTGTGITDRQEIKKIIRFPYSKSDFKRDLKSIFSDLYQNYYPDKIGISVLNSQHNGFMDRFFLKKFKTRPVFINRDMNLPIRINYSKGLGNDRICNAVAASDLYGNKNILVIDFGTATTFTLLSDNILTGGLILPGIRTSLLSLTERTSLPEVKLTFPENLITGNTKDNIKAGILFQSLYCTERIIVETRKKYRGLFVIATGGFAKLIASKTDLINITDRYLVLKGINILI